MGKIFMVKGPTNWWRVVAMAAVPLFLYTTYRYGEAQATLNHIQQHLSPSHYEAAHPEHGSDESHVAPQRKN
jgi:hypothetical protein